MIWVRFQDGTTIQYNTANWVTRSQWGYSDLYENQGGAWVAHVPNTAIIEVIKACNVFNPITDRTHARMEAIEKELRSLKRALKKAGV